MVVYSPTQTFSEVFGSDAFGSKTLQQVVKLKGGGLNALGRHTVAALFNTSNTEVTYPYDTAYVIAQFNAVYLLGKKSDYNSLKDIFVEANEAGCPLN